MNLENNFSELEPRIISASDVEKQEKSKKILKKLGVDFLKYILARLIAFVAVVLFLGIIIWTMTSGYYIVSFIFITIIIAFVSFISILLFSNKFVGTSRIAQTLRKNEFLGNVFIKFRIFPFRGNGGQSKYWRWSMGLMYMIVAVLAFIAFFQAFSGIHIFD